MNDPLATQRAALHDGALVLDAADLGTLVTTGADRKAWLNGMVTCDVAPLRPGEGALGLAVAKTGKLLAELVVVASEDALFVGLARERAASIAAHLDRHLIMEDAAIVDASADHAWLALHGPRAGEGAAAAREAGATVALVDRTGRGGAVAVTTPLAHDAVLAAVRARLGDRCAIATPEGWEQLRIEEGLGRFGVDYGEDNYPQEASLERAHVSFSKGCYLGQEAVFMLEKRGHAKKRLVRLHVEGDGGLAVGAPIALADGSSVGEVTSHARRPGGGVVALGFVKWKHAVAGVDLAVDGRPARVA
jgi:folate-binding protein YgfZ